MHPKLSTTRSALIALGYTAIGTMFVAVAVPLSMFYLFGVTIRFIGHHVATLSCMGMDIIIDTITHLEDD